MTTGRRTRTYIEFFCGGGMARAGLGANWHCLLANDIDAAKAAAYRANWGQDHLVVGDVRELRADAIAGRPDLAWASSPCQDVSQAGTRSGLDGGRSGALWPAIDLVRQLSQQGRAPRIAVVENVVGLAASRSGDDLAAVAAALASAGYRVGALVVDAKLFVPQSRQRLFVIAVADDIQPWDKLVSTAPVRAWHPAPLVAAAARCEHWIWWNPRPPSPRATALADVLEAEPNIRWHAAEETAALLALMSERDRARLEAARRLAPIVGTLTRRTRPLPAGGRQQRVELRLDEVAGCLRTPGGGSSQQNLVIADAESVRTRPVAPREAARLMGLPDDYRLPKRREDALRLLGDGVAVPVVRHLAATLFEPLLDRASDAAPRVDRKGIKAATRATTLYLLPHELRRLRGLAVELDVSLHDLMLRGLDKVLAEHGQRPVERYS